MAASAECKIQISYGKDGLLLNIYAQDSVEAEKLLTNVQDLATLIESVGASLGRSNPAQMNRSNPSQSAPVSAISYAKKALGATSTESTVNTEGLEQLTDKYGSVYTYGRPDAPECVNGKMIHKSGVKRDGSPYWGWYDPADGPKPVRMNPGYVKVKSIHPDSVPFAKK